MSDLSPADSSQKSIPPTYPRPARLLSWQTFTRLLPWLVLLGSLGITYELWLHTHNNVSQKLLISAGLGTSLLLSVMTWLQLRNRTRAIWEAQARQAFREKLEASEERYRGLFTHMSNGFALYIAVRDATNKIVDYRILEVNPAFENMSGHTRESLLGKRLKEIMPQTENHWIGIFASVVESGQPRTYENYAVEFGRWLSTDIYRPAPEHCAVVIADISERKQAFDALRESEERWKFALEGAGDGVWDWNIPQDKVVFSTRYKEMHGYSDEDIAANEEAWEQRIHPDDRSRVAADIHAYLENRTDSYINEHRVICKDGSIKWVLARGMVVSRDHGGKPLRMIGTHADITERKMAEERVHHLAHYDALTDLPNRSLIHDRLQQAAIKARRDMSRMAVMFLDLDKFKPVNDTYGHDIGDLLLKEVAKRLLGCVRESDTVARLGGDEFVVLLPKVEMDQDAATVAEKILAALNQPFVIEQHTLDISSSVGIAMYPEHGEDEKLLLINADIAMYHAKKHGRNNYQFYVRGMQGMAQ